MRGKCFNIIPFKSKGHWFIFELQRHGKNFKSDTLVRHTKEKTNILHQLFYLFYSF